MQEYSNKELHFFYDHNIYEISHINPLLELFRYYIITNIRNTCKKELQKLKINIKFDDIFSRWILLQHSNKIYRVDPLIPEKPYYFSQFKKDIINLSNINRNDKKIEIIIDSLTKQCQYSIQQIRLFVQSLFYRTNYTNINAFICDKVVKKNVVYYVLKVNMEYDIFVKIFNENIPTITFEINEYNFTKIYQIYKKQNNIVSDKVKNQYFHNLLYCLFLRYYSLKSLNQQAAVLPSFYQHLQKRYNVGFELFASSINCYYPNYCSIFDDIERYIGSKGSFNNIIPKKGFYVVNPPFDEEIMKVMSKKLCLFLDSTKEQLSFLVILPYWNTSKNAIEKYGTFEAYDILENSKYLKYKKIFDKSKTKFINYLKLSLMNLSGIYVLLLSNKQHKREEIDSIIDKYWINSDMLFSNDYKIQHTYYKKKSLLKMIHTINIKLNNMQFVLYYYPKLYDLWRFKYMLKKTYKKTLYIIVLSNKNHILNYTNFLGKKNKVYVKKINNQTIIYGIIKK